MGLKKYIIISIIFFTFHSASADYNFEEDKKQQVFFLKDDIFRIQNLLDRNNDQLEDLNLELKSYNDTIMYISDLIAIAQDDRVQEEDSMMLEEIELNNFNSKINTLKESFQQKVIWMYKHGSNYEEEILFTSSSLTEFYARLGYLNKISQLRKKDFKRIQNNQYVVEEKKKILSLRSRQRLGYISAKKEDQRTLYEKKLLVQDRIRSLASDNENYTRQMDKKKKDLNNLQNRIAFLKENFVYKIDQTVTYSDIPFSALKGKLILPVNSVNILEDFGTSVNPATLSLTYNNGIDVSIARNSDVKCIAAGTVEDIRYLPFYGNVVIVNHGENYRTVYGILNEIKVTKGSLLTAGQVIANTHDNPNGQSFHFELWSGSDPVDPKDWFKRG